MLRVINFRMYVCMFVMCGLQAARKLAIAEVTLESFESRLEAAES